MDLRSEISQSKQPSAAESDQNKLPNVDCGNILNPTPLARFNPYDNLAKKQSPVKKRLTSEVNVQGKPRFNPYDKLLNKKSPSSKKQTSDVIKASFDQGTSDMGKSSVDQVKVIVDQGKESTDVISAVVAELAKTEKETGIEKESEKNLLSEKETETEIETDKETGIEKESEKILLSEKEMETEIETEKQKEIEKESEKESEKQKEIEKESEKQKEIEKKESEKMVTYKSRVKKLAVVKDKATDKVSDVLVEKKAEKEKDKKIKLKFKVMEPVKTTPKSSEKKSAKVLSEASVLRSKKQKEIEKEETQTKRKLVLAKVDDISKKPKHKVKKDADEKKKRKRGDSSGSDKGEDITPEDKGKKKMKGKGPVKVKKDDSVKEEDILPEGVMKQLVNKFLKSSLVKAETDEENESKLSKKGKKKEKVLTPSEIQHQEYLQKWPILQARSAPTALHTAIHGVKNVDMQKFLVEIGFGSYVRFDITKIPGRLGRYVVENFDAETCRLKLERERFIEATVSKVHELLGIPIGGQSLLSLETRPVGDEFEKVWLGQFEGKSAKQLRVNDIANKLIESKEVDFLFKVNFLTLFTNTMGMVAGMQGEINFDVLKHVREDTDIRSIDWCDYIFHCLKISKKPSTLTNKYTGPYTLLALLYLDSTNYTKLPVPRTRPAIKQWSSHLMSQRHDMELKEEYFGMSELFDESELPETEGFVAGCSSSYKKDLLKNLEEKLAAISNERACFEELLTTAGLEYPGDLDLIELHKKYVQIFKHPVALNGEDLDLDDDNGNDRRLSGTDP